MGYENRARLADVATGRGGLRDVYASEPTEHMTITELEASLQALML